MTAKDKLVFGGSFIVHLERSRARLPQVNHLRTILPKPVLVFNAIDGANPSTSFQNYVKNSCVPEYPFELNPAEIATFLSHRECWHKIIQMNIDYGLIIEDDIDLDVTMFYPILEKATTVLKQGDYLRIPIKTREKERKIIFESEFSIFEPRVIGLGMQCQLITREAAKKLLKASKTFDRPVDTFIQMRWLHKVNVISCNPTGVSEISQSIGGSTIQGNLSSLQKLRRELLRPLYRLKVYIWSLKSNNLKGESSPS